MKYLKSFNITIIQLVLVIAIASCKNHSDTTEGNLSVSAKEKIDSLTTDDKKKVFLEYIVDEDQKIRADISQIALDHGYDSQEHKDGIDLMKKMDRENLQKIEYYLKKYGNPSIERHGNKASYTPWLVIHHSYTIDARKRNFKYLYQAYLDKDLRESSFSLYLNRLYRMIHEKKYEIPNGEDEIPSLITALGLNEKLFKTHLKSTFLKGE